MSGCKTGGSGDYSINSAATTPKRDFNFSKGKIYVTNQGTNSVSIADLDGSGGVSLGSIHSFITTPHYIVIDSPRKKLYISNAGLREVIQANLDGSEGVYIDAAAIAGEGWCVTTVDKLTIDPLNGKLFIGASKSKIVNNTVLIRAEDPTVIIQANLDGTGKRFIAQDILKKIDPNYMHISLVAVDPKHRTMYLSASKCIFMVRMDSSEIKKVGEGVGATCAIDSEDKKIYSIFWKKNPEDPRKTQESADNRPNTLAEFKEFLNGSDESGKYYIHRTNLEGNDLVNLGDLKGLMDNPKSIALDTENKKMYIANWGNSTIIRANLDGTGAENIGNLNGTVKYPLYIAVLPPGAVGKPQNSEKK